MRRVQRVAYVVRRVHRLAAHLNNEVTSLDAEIGRATFRVDADHDDALTLASGRLSGGSEHQAEVRFRVRRVRPRASLSLSRMRWCKRLGGGRIAERDRHNLLLPIVHNSETYLRAGSETNHSPGYVVMVFHELPI